MAIFCILSLFVCHFSCYALAVFEAPTSSYPASSHSANAFYLLTDPTALDPYHHHNDDHFIMAIADDNVDASPNRLMRSKRAAAAPHYHQTHGFIRLGRDPYNSKKSDKNLIRFGRNESPKTNGFIRFGRSDNSFMRFGRNSEDAGEPMRFGRRGDKFIRFGRSGGGGGSSVAAQKTHPVVKDRSLEDFLKTNDRIVSPESIAAAAGDFDSLSSDSLLRAALQSPPPTLNRFGRNGNFIRFGRRDNGFIRLGKKKSERKLDDVEKGAVAVDAGDTNEIVQPDDGMNNNEYEGYDVPRMAEKSVPSQEVNGLAGNDENAIVSDNRDKLLSMFETDYM